MLVRGVQLSTCLGHPSSCLKVELSEPLSSSNFLVFSTVELSRQLHCNLTLDFDFLATQPQCLKIRSNKKAHKSPTGLCSSVFPLITSRKKKTQKNIIFVTTISNCINYTMFATLEVRIGRGLKCICNRTRVIDQEYNVVKWMTKLFFNPSFVFRFCFSSKDFGWVLQHV